MWSLYACAVSLVEICTCLCWEDEGRESDRLFLPPKWRETPNIHGHWHHWVPEGAEMGHFIPLVEKMEFTLLCLALLDDQADLIGSHSDMPSFVISFTASQIRWDRNTLSCYYILTIWPWISRILESDKAGPLPSGFLASVCPWTLLRKAVFPGKKELSLSLISINVGAYHIPVLLVQGVLGSLGYLYFGGSW